MHNKNHINKSAKHYKKNVSSSIFHFKGNSPFIYNKNIISFKKNNTDIANINTLIDIFDNNEVNNNFITLESTNKIITFVQKLYKSISTNYILHPKFSSKEEELFFYESLLKEELNKEHSNITCFDYYLNYIYKLNDLNNKEKRLLKEIIVKNFGTDFNHKTNKYNKKENYKVEIFAIPIFGKLSDINKLFNDNNNKKFIIKLFNNITKLDYHDTKKSIIYPWAFPLIFNALSRVDVLNALSKMMGEVIIDFDKLPSNVIKEILYETHNVINKFNILNIHKKDIYTGCLLPGIKVIKNNQNNFINDCLNNNIFNFDKHFISGVQWKSNVSLFLEDENIDLREMSISEPMNLLGAQSHIIGMHLVHDLYQKIGLKSFNGINIMKFEKENKIAISACQDTKIVALSEKIDTPYINSMKDFINIVKYECTEKGPRMKLT